MWINEHEAKRLDFIERVFRAGSLRLEIVEKIASFCGQLEVGGAVAFISAVNRLKDPCSDRSEADFPVNS